MDGKKVHVCYREKPTSIPFVIVRPIFTYFWRQVIRSTNTGASKLHSAGKKRYFSLWFHFILGSISIFLSFILIVITLPHTKTKIKIEPQHTYCHYLHEEQTLHYFKNSML